MESRTVESRVDGTWRAEEGSVCQVLPRDRRRFPESTEIHGTAQSYRGYIMPAHRFTARAEVEHAPLLRFVSQQEEDDIRDIPHVGRQRKFIRNRGERFTAQGSRDDTLGEGGTERIAADPRHAEHKSIRQHIGNLLFALILAHTVHTTGATRCGLRFETGATPVQHVIRGKVDKPRTGVAAGESNLPGTQGVDEVRVQRIAFTGIRRGNRRAVDHRTRFGMRQHVI